MTKKTKQNPGNDQETYFILLLNLLIVSLMSEHKILDTLLLCRSCFTKENQIARLSVTAKVSSEMPIMTKAVRTAFSIFSTDKLDLGYTKFADIPISKEESEEHFENHKN